MRRSIEPEIPGTTSAHEPTAPIRMSRKYPPAFISNKFTFPASGKKQSAAAAAKGMNKASAYFQLNFAPFNFSPIEGTPPIARPTNSVTVGMG